MNQTQRHRILSTLVVLTALLALTGCGIFDDDDAADESAASQAALQNDDTDGADPDDDGAISFDAATIPQLFEQVSPAVVSVEVDSARGAGEGSGIVWSSDGVIVTNAHVVEGATEVTVLLADGSRFPATVEARDERTDVAVLRVDADDLPALEVADELPAVGTPVIAVGNPLGFENSVSFGIVSGLQRSIPSQGRSPALVDLLQTDAAISPGNSGGALVDLEGRLVGMNVAFIPPAARAVSVGFAIPVGTVASSVEQLLATGQVRHAYLGVGLSSLVPRSAERLGSAVDRGAIVTQIEPGGPAEDAGLRLGDVIVGSNGDTIEGVGDLLGVLRRSSPGRQIELEVVREGATIELEATLVDRPEQ